MDLHPHPISCLAAGEEDREPDGSGGYLASALLLPGISPAYERTFPSLALLFEIWLCMLAVRKGWHHYREGTVMARRSSLLEIVLFDSVACFICIVSGLITNMVFFMVAEVST